MKKAFGLLTNLVKIGSLIAVVLNILKVAMEEIADKFPELVEDGEDQEEKKAELKPTIEPEKKPSILKSLFKLPF